jgi:hypothetical protein
MKGDQRMPVTTNTSRRELAFRSNEGLEVTLFWSEPGDELTVTVFDSRSDELVELPAAPENALDVFEHPFAYAAFLGVDYHEPALAA